MEGEIEYYFLCPFCGENISMVIEVFHGDQSYIEDCEVCCRPINISYKCENSIILDFVATRE